MVQLHELAATYLLAESCLASAQGHTGYGPAVCTHPGSDLGPAVLA